MKKILITGAAGFIGLALTKKLSNSFKIDLIDNFSRGKKDREFKKILKNKNIRLIKHDLYKDLKINIQYDYIFHLAAIVGVENVLLKPFDVLLNNFKFLENILKFSKKQKKLQKLFFFSTSEVYAGSIKSKLIKFPTPENQVLTLPNLSDKRSSYLLSKIYGESMCLHSGLPVIIVRPHNIYGPRMGFAHVIPQLAEKVLNKEEFIVFNSKHKRTFCFIDDFVNYLILLMHKKKLKHNIFNIGNNKEEIRIINLAKKIMKYYKIEKKIISKTIRLKNEVEIKKITNLDEGLSKTLNWYKNYLT